MHNNCMEPKEDENALLEKLKVTVDIQAKQIETLKSELEALRKNFVSVSQFPKAQLAALKKYNGVTALKNIICFVVFRGFVFGLMVGKLSENAKGQAEAKVGVSFEDTGETFELRGTITKLNCGLSLLELNRGEVPRKLQSHCLVLDEFELAKAKQPGTKLATYAPGLEIVTGYVLSSQLMPDGELKCQLTLEEYYSGALVFDEALLPVGICSGLKNALQAQGKATRLEVSSILPLTIKVPPAPTCKILGMIAILRELDKVVQARAKEEVKKIEVLDDERLKERNEQEMRIAKTGRSDRKSARVRAEERFEELNEEELQRAKNFSLMEEFIELDSEANNKLQTHKKP
eukprot:TRINITY_DN6160_c0_g1_i7.p1 TRINITY_DN6160_c0_g1~~TRINITY_DN6160_c0_g1_i7.p1  ORF type:complete len:347 (+),score=104.65 TRINITY_DN6160_c0_g1_i7:127-1167(+)